MHPMSNRGNKQENEAGTTGISSGDLLREGSRRAQIYRDLGKLVREGWELEEVNPGGAALSRPSGWSKRLFVAGFLFLPLMGFGLLLWALALVDRLSGAKVYLYIPFEGHKKGSALRRGRLSSLQRILLAGYGFLFAFWLIVALPALMPHYFYTALPVPEELSSIFMSRDEYQMGAFMSAGGRPAAFSGFPGLTSTPTAQVQANSPTPTRTPWMPADQTSTATSTATPTQTATPRPDPKKWMNWPVLPKFSPNWVEIYQKGLEMGNNPQAFSVVGDCQSFPYLFLGMYDGTWYSTDSLDENLQVTIKYFSGSFSRYGMTVLDGATAASMLVPGWANRNWCDVDESPLACELRLHKPSIVIINVGTHWTGRNSEYLRTIVETIVEAGALPILATKGDNLEGDHSINREIAQIASEYDVPLWNLWRAVRDLPGQGLDPYRQGGYMYYTSTGLEVRRLTALKVLDAVRQAVD